MTDSTYRIQIYGTRLCGFCTAAKRLCEQQGVPYEEILLDRDPERRMALVEETGWRTVPMIFVDGSFIGGFQELRALVSQGGLKPV